MTKIPPSEWPSNDEKSATYFLIKWWKKISNSLKLIHNTYYNSNLILTNLWICHLQLKYCMWFCRQGQAPITESPCPTNNQVNILVVHPFEQDESLLSSSKTSFKSSIMKPKTLSSRICLRVIFSLTKRWEYCFFFWKLLHKKLQRFVTKYRKFRCSSFSSINCRCLAYFDRKKCIYFKSQN